MKASFKIAKWTIVVGGILFLLLSVIATFMVGSAGHNSGVKGSTILANVLMVTLLLSSNKFQKNDNSIFNWLTIGSMLWVMICIVIGALDDYTKGDEVTMLTGVVVPAVLFLFVTRGLVKGGA